MIELKRKPQQPAQALTGGAGRAEDVQQGATPPPRSEGQKQALQPFKSLDGTRDYRKLYRIACNFHERYNSPPIVAKSSEEYSRYWQAVTDDMFATIAANDKDPFLAAMLGAVYDELEREQEQPEKSK